MKRPYLLYLVIALQCAVLLPVGLLYRDAANDRLAINQLAAEQISISDRLQNAHADILRKLEDLHAQPSPQPQPAPVFERRRISFVPCLEEHWQRTAAGWTYIKTRACGAPAGSGDSGSEPRQ